MSRSALRRLARDHRGATVIFVAIAMIMFLGIAALAIDIGYLYMVRNELQNGADSGALAGAQVLYNTQGTAVNAGANAVGQDYVERNYSEQAEVTVESVTRGHWSFYNHTFTANENVLTPPVLWNRTADELDHDLNFVNAVQVVTRRKRVGGELPEGFFARIFNERTEVKATAVGYIGFAGKLEPNSVDQPIAICKEAITDPQDENAYTCGVGRMLNSGQNAGHQTAGWTNFSQPCETASDSDVKALVCGAGNPVVLDFTETMGTTNGVQQNVFDKLRDCWWNDPTYDRDGDGIADKTFTMRLPVISCPGGAVGNCSSLAGMVEVHVVWITRNDKNQMNEVPRWMDEWPPASDPLRDTVGPFPKCTGTGQQCWESFRTYFQLKDVLNNDDAFYEDKTMYFKPDCTPHEPTGVTGGENFGILARIPVLVK